MMNLIYPFPGLSIVSPEVFITPEYDLLVGSTFSCIFEDNRQVRSIRACSPPRLPVLQRQHVAKAFAGAAGNSAATHQPQRLMQPLPSSSVYSVPRRCAGRELLPVTRTAWAAGSSGSCGQLLVLLAPLITWCTGANSIGRIRGV